MNRMKKLVAIALSTVTVGSVAAVGGSISVGASGTGAGLAEYALNAYYEGWQYVWGGTEPGAVDCSGLIWSYCGGDRMEMRADAQANGRDWGYVSDGIPRVHGLGLSRPNHVGVYIEDGMEVDARGSDYGVCYQQIGENGWNNWDYWFKLTAVEYPDNGWENFNGNYYYYEDGEYIVNTSRTIDGTTYYFDSKGHSSETPSDPSSKATSSSPSDSSSGSSSSGKTQRTVWSKGANDEEVVKIQTRLAELGYYDGPIDGDFGEGTEAAFKAFQANAGLTVDGIAGADRDVLYSDNAPAAKQKSTEPETTEPEATEPEETEPEETEPEATEPEETEPEATEPEETEPEETEPEATEPVTEAPAEPETQTPTEGSATPVVIAENGDFSEQVSNIQVRLTELGYYALDTSGLFGDYTEEAVKNFQMANGIEATGKVDAKTFEVLFSDDAIESVLPAVGAPAEEEPVEEPAQAPTQAAAQEDEVYFEPAGDASDSANGVMTGNSDSVAFVDSASSFDRGASEQIPLTTIAPTKPASTATSKVNSASSSVQSATKANETVKSVEKNSAVAPAAKTANLKITDNIWLWLLVAAAALGVAAFILLMHSRKQSKASSSTKAKLNDRW